MTELHLQPKQLEKFFKFLSEYEILISIRSTDLIVDLKKFKIDYVSKDHVGIRNKDNSFIALGFDKLDAYIGDGDDNFVDFVSDDFNAEVEILNSKVDVYSFLYNL